MPETRHRTILEIGVDDRGLRQLGPTMERALNPKVAEAFEKSMERSTAALSKMVEQQAKLGKLLDDQARRSQQRQRDDNRRQRDEDKRSRERGGGAGGTMLGTLGAHAVMRGNQLAGQMPYNEGFLSQMLSAIPILGPAFGGAVGGAMSFWQSHAAQQIARTRAFGSTGLGGRAYGSQARGGQGLASMGVGFGYGPSELPGVLAGLGQASGMRGSALGGIAPRALALQALGGLDMGATGSIANSVLAGTHGSSGLANMDAEDRTQTIITEAVAAGIMGGLREGRIGEALQQIGAAVTGMRSQGIMLDVGETLALMRGLGQMGGAFSGEAGVGAAQSITRGFAGAADREGVLSALAIRNRMQTTGEDYETAGRAIESNPVAAFRSVMSTLGQFRGTRGYETMLRNQFERMGISISRGQAHQLSNMSDDQLSAMSGSTPGAESVVSDFLTSRNEEVRGVLGTARGEAGYEAQRAGIGAGMGGTVQAYRGLELQMIRAFQPMAQSFAQGVIHEVQGLFDAFQQGGIAGLMERSMNRLVDAMVALPRLIAEAVGVNPEQVDAAQNSAASFSDDVDAVAADAIESIIGPNAASAGLRGDFMDVPNAGQQAGQNGGAPGSTQTTLHSTSTVGEITVTVVDRTSGGIEVAR